MACTLCFLLLLYLRTLQRLQNEIETARVELAAALAGHTAAEVDLAKFKQE
jgi:hypothetical protein